MTGNSLGLKSIGSATQRIIWQSFRPLLEHAHCAQGFWALKHDKSSTYCLGKNTVNGPMTMFGFTIMMLSLFEPKT